MAHMQVNPHPIKNHVTTSEFQGKICITVLQKWGHASFFCLIIYWWRRVMQKPLLLDYPLLACNLLAISTFLYDHNQKPTGFKMRRNHESQKRCFNSWENKLIILLEIELTWSPIFTSSACFIFGFELLMKYFNIAIERINGMKFQISLRISSH